MKINKEFFKNNLYYIIISVIGLTVVLVNRILTGFNGIMTLTDLATIFAICYIILNSKNSVWGLVFNLISTAFIAITSFYQHLWLNGFICACINIPMFVFGIITWRKKLAKQTSKIRINRLSKKSLALVFLSYITISIGLLFALRALNGNLYYLDAFYSAASVVSVILCSLAYFDQFYISYIANTIGIIMYSILCAQNLNNLPLIFTSVLYLIGNIIATINWIKLEKKAKVENNSNNNSEITKINDDKINNKVIAE